MTHLKQKDCSIGHSWLASCGLGNGTQSRGWPHIQCQSLFMVAGDITTSVNKGRRANERSTYLDVYGMKPPTKGSFRRTA